MKNIVFKNEINEKLVLDVSVGNGRHAQVAPESDAKVGIYLSTGTLIKPKSKKYRILKHKSL